MGMGKTDATSGHSDRGHSAPPAYEEKLSSIASEPPLPPLSGTKAKTTGRQTLVFPSKIGFFRKPATVRNLIHTVSYPKQSGRDVTVLHSTADRNSPPLASTERVTDITSKWRWSYIKMPNIRGGDGGNGDGVVALPHRGYLPSFCIAVGPEHRAEVFEWRQSKGPEVRGLRGCQPSGQGFKLVRLCGRDPAAGGGRTRRRLGFSSRGEHIVAVAAPFEGKRGGFNFEFTGPGLTGTLGEMWEIATVMTFLSIMKPAP